MTYASCAACGWRGVRHNFNEHVCCSRNDYRANHADLQEGWPDDRTTWEKLKGRARDAINRDLAPNPQTIYTWDDLLPELATQRHGKENKT